MGTARDLSFDYAERVKGDTLNGFEYSKVVPSPFSTDSKGEHFHFWVPADMTTPADRFCKIAGAYREATAKFTVVSASWDFVPAIGERRPAQQRMQRKELFLIDWRHSRKAKQAASEDVKNHHIAALIPHFDFEVMEMTNTVEWTCGTGLTEEDVQLLLIRGDVTVHIELPRLHKITKEK